MKSAKKAIIAAVCAVMLVVGSVAGTMAYLTDDAKVVNTFTVGKVKITLDEAKANADGSLVEGAARVNANKYHLLPGHIYNKDPKVHVDSLSEDCYLFVKVENGIADIEDATTIASQMGANGWKLVNIPNTNNIYVYAKNAGDTPVEKTVVHKSTTVPVFETFKIAGEGVIGGDKPTGYTGTDKYISDYAKANITVTAYAVQKDGFEGKTPAEIWTTAGFN